MKSLGHLVNSLSAIVQFTSKCNSAIYEQLVLGAKIILSHKERGWRREKQRIHNVCVCVWESGCHKITERVQHKMGDGIKSRYNISRKVSWRTLLAEAAHDKFSRVSLLFREERGYTCVGAPWSLGERPRGRGIKRVEMRWDEMRWKAWFSGKRWAWDALRERRKIARGRKTEKRRLR